MTGRPEPPDIVARIVDHARHQPAAVALDFAGEVLTYRELDRWSAAIARDLGAAGIGAGDGVALLAPRGVAFMAGALGAMRAGAWYVAIDPEQSARRQNLLVERGRCAAVLAIPGAAVPDVPAGVTMLGLVPKQAEPWSAPAGPGLPAYACFTSGTTAGPKPVLVSRGALSAFAEAFIVRVGVERAWAMAGFCAPDWDGFAIDVWVPLAAGAAACSGEHQDRTNPEAIARYLCDRGITAAFLPTALGQLVMASPRLAGASRLRHLCLGGDRLTRRTGQEGGYRLWNVYGPTETTVAAIVSPVEAAGPDDIPLGWPLPGAVIEVVDEELRPVPDGERGELLIGGDGVALGYLGQPRATAAAFVPGPGGRRRYRTGDLGRTLPDGQFAFHGRRDRQVSVHGRRIELDGIRAALREVPGVRDAAAVITEAGAARTLTAFVVQEAGRDLTEAQVRAGLGDWLSGQQMPDRVLFVPAIPDDLHAGPPRDGRPDAAAVAALLAGLEPPEPAAGAATGAQPRDEVDECVVDAWAELLGGRRPALDDDFFAAGGDSLLAVQLMQQLQAAFDVELRLLAFFDAPTPRTLADLLRVELERQFDEMSVEEQARLLAEPA